MRRIFVGIAIVAGLAACAWSARASVLIDRNANGVTLAVNAKGEALISYTAAGRHRHVLAWGAINAIAPTQSRAQVSFRLDYAGGWGKYHRDYRNTFRNKCTPYTGPPLEWKVAACTAPDGSFWALQAWQRGLPNYGVAPSGSEGAWELRLSHWTGALPVLEIQTDWPGIGGITSSARSRTTTRPCSASGRRPLACRSTRSGATSTSTRTTRSTAPGRSARTAS
jgi:hypothetical protein